MTLLLIATTSLCVSQIKIPKKYTVEVTYISGNREIIPIKNYDGKANIPKPIAHKGSILYDGEHLLLNVKSIKILKTEYFSVSKNSSIGNYQVTRVNYYDPRLGKNRIINVITDPVAERNQREVEAEARKHSIFSRSADEENKIEIPTSPSKPIVKDTINKSENALIAKDTIVISRRQGVYESDGNGNFNRIENSGFLLVGNLINTQTDGNFERKKIGKDSQEYIKLSKLNIRKGMFIIEERLNKDNVVILYRILPVKLRNND